ncbi:SOS response-associated peptidase [Methylosinus sp. PW1]|uniref:SOS response-associated peptidase n=1 Tax=Methylosinus sp. PW1 TaxID=107636 RepID=UPI000A7BA47A|nr:SOS response-associated peptidase [Methylosinus sp. PW1]
MSVIGPPRNLRPRYNIAPTTTIDVVRSGDPTRIELHHHDVDGRGPPTFDWPITAGYCRAIAEAFGVPLYFSWRDGGLRREMLRDSEPTASVMFETPEGGVTTVGGRGVLGTLCGFRR